MAKIYHVIQIKLKSVSSRKCPYDHRVINKAYSSAITVTNIYQRFTYKMAAKINRHRYGTKLSLSPYNWCSFLQTRHPSGQWSPWHSHVKTKGNSKTLTKRQLGKITHWNLIFLLYYTSLWKNSQATMYCMFQAFKISTMIFCNNFRLRPCQLTKT